MVKFMNILVLALALWPILTLAQSDSKYCQKPDNEYISQACETSKILNIPLMKFMMAVLPASTELAASECSFVLSSQFFDMKAKLLADKETTKAYKFLIAVGKNTPPRAYDKQKCASTYEMFGPSNVGKKGPNGGPKAALFK